MATRISMAAAAAACNGVVDLLDSGPGPGYIEVRTGAQPATVGTAATGTLLARLTLADPAFGNASAASPAVAVASAITSDLVADASGTAGWFRAYASTGAAVIDGSVSTTGAGGDLQLDSVAIIQGGTVTITGWTVSHATA